MNSSQLESTTPWAGLAGDAVNTDDLGHVTLPEFGRLNVDDSPGLDRHELADSGNHGREDTGHRRTVTGNRHPGASHRGRPFDANG